MTEVVQLLSKHQAFTFPPLYGQPHRSRPDEPGRAPCRPPNPQGKRWADSPQYGGPQYWGIKTWIFAKSYRKQKDLETYWSLIPEKIK